MLTNNPEDKSYMPLPLRGPVQQRDFCKSIVMILAPITDCRRRHKEANIQ